MLSRFKKIGLIFIVSCVMALTGCTFLLPSKQTQKVSTWKNFDEARVAYDKVLPGITTLEELRMLGYDPYAKPNIEIENYLKVRQRFDNMRGDATLPELVNECLKVLERCIAYVVYTGFDNEDRVGNSFLDITGLHREIHKKGWLFEAIFVINDKVVIYKLWSGQPHREEYVTETTPLGPLQSIGGSVLDKVNPI